MSQHRPFRFGISDASTTTSSAAEWVAHARKVEDLGYATLWRSHHLSIGGLGMFASLAAAATATTSLRLASHVIPVDFYPIATLAQEAAAIDWLSAGRLELGIGAGWYWRDYEAAGLPFDAPGVRLKRLQEAVQVIKRLFEGEAVTCCGDHYQVKELTLKPRPVQRPHPPLLIGGGGKRGLSLAAREADIVSLDMPSTVDGKKDAAGMAAEVVAQQVAWVREAAGERFDQIELHKLVNMVVVTDDQQRGVEEIARRIASFPATIGINLDVSQEVLLASPQCLIGSVEQIVETLQERRERFGISYITVPGSLVDDFAPIVARLAGT